MTDPSTEAEDPRLAIRPEPVPAGGEAECGTLDDDAIAGLFRAAAAIQPWEKLHHDNEHN